MNYVTVSANEYLYPDRYVYQSGGNEKKLSSAKNAYAQFQILFSELSNGASIAVSAKADFPGLEVEMYEEVAIPVEQNINIPPENAVPHCPERIAPYYLYDCFKPFDGTLTPFANSDGTFSAAMYIAFKIPEKAKPGNYTSVVILELEGRKISIPVAVKVYDITLTSDTDFRIINGFSTAMLTKFHNVQARSEEYKILLKKYYAMLRRMYQNTCYTGGIKAEKTENGWKFDFTEFEAQVEEMLAAGFTSFLAPSVGGRRSWNESTILVNGMPSMSYEAYEYLSKYLPAFRDLLKKHGWTDRFYQGIADEPNAANATEYRALCGLVRKLFPEIRLIDAVSYGNLHGALDVWIPLNAEYDKHKVEFETFRQNGEQLWFYVCCGPRGDQYINRFMDYPLLSTRYLYWGAYKYDLKGYLHWAANCYQPGQDPYKCSCPEHHNCDTVCILPAGDTHVIYPGNGEPYMSVRLEAQRQSVEDLMLLRAAAAKNKEAADKLCGELFKSFKDVEYDVNKFDTIREELLAAAE